jgi:hypothetical protein
VRQIVEGDYFAECVERLGGYRAIDLALETIVEALRQNPYGFRSFKMTGVRFVTLEQR